jgi:phosphatidylglycerol---prolipoprotein diacylglyceryl transferase
MMYIIGLTIGFFIIRSIVRKRKMRLSSDEVMDYIVYIAMGLLIGGRVGYFLFYDFSVFYTDPLELFKLWHGGMSFHGGLIGGFIGAYWFTKKKRIDFWTMADITVVPLGLALALGRIGNFINGELYGRPWNGFLCVDYTQNPHTGFLPQLCRYPSQIFEAAKNLIIFSVLFTLKDRKLKKGFLFWLFVFMYGCLRFSVEFFREPDSQLGFFLGWMTMGQILSSTMAIAGAGMLIYLWRKK